MLYQPKQEYQAKLNPQAADISEYEQVHTINLNFKQFKINKLKAEGYRKVNKPYS